MRILHIFKAICIFLEHQYLTAFFFSLPPRILLELDFKIQIIFSFHL